MLLLLVAGGRMLAQSYPYHFNALTVDEGLSHTDATDIVQDKQGYIWVSTLFGINRFDGYHIRRYYNGNMPLGNAYRNRVLCMGVDSTGFLWLGTEAGFQRFDTHTEGYIDYTLERASQMLDPVKLVVHSPEVFYALAGSGRLRCYVAKGRRLAEKKLPLPPGISINDIDMSQDGRLFMATTEGLWVLQANGTVVRVNVDGCPEKQFNRVFVDQSEHVLLGSAKNLYLTLPLNEHWAVAKTMILSAEVTAVVQETDGDYWVNANQRLVKLSKDLDFIQEINNGSPVKYINLSGLRTLFIDRSQCLWTGSFGNGVHYADLYEKKFYTLQHLPQEPHSLSGSYVRAILDENGRDLWVGTNDNGLNHYDLEKQQVVQVYNNYNSAVRLPGNTITALATDNERNLWIGGIQGIVVMRPDRQQLWRPPGSENFPNHVVDVLVKDCFGNIWFGDHTHNFGVIYKDAAGTYQVKRYGESYFIHADSVNPQLMAASTHGLKRLIVDKEGNILKSLSYQATGKPNSLSSNYIYPIAKQNDSTYWIGTIGGGLNRMILRPDDSFTITAFTEGIFKDVEGLEIDDQGYIWLAGNGLQRFDPRTGAVVRYDKNDGLQGNSFKVNSSCRGAEGVLFFGGINGLSYFRPADITSNPVVAAPQITRLSVNNEPEDSTRYITADAAVRLNHLQNNFVISFSAMHYANPLKCRFRYMLKGHDDTWQYTDGKSAGAAYSNLEFKDYTFLVEASNNDGVWSGRQASIMITVIPPWWKSTAAKLFYILFFIGALLGIYVYQARWYRLKNELALRAAAERQREAIHQQREQLYQQQLQLFTNISHDFRTPLTLIRGPLERLVSEDEQPTRAHAYQLMLRNVKRLISLVSELMNFKKVADGAIRLQVQPMSVSEFCQSLYEEFAALAEGKNIRFDVIDKTGSGTSVNYFDAQVLEKILLNLLNNAFKYTDNGGQVTLQYFLEKELFKPSFNAGLQLPHELKASQYIYFLVTDTGIGITEASLPDIFDRYFRVSNHHLGSGVGLALVKSLTHLHKGEIAVFSERNKGTEFLVALPWGKENYSAGEIIVPGIQKGSQLEQLDNEIAAPLNLTPMPNVTIRKSKHILLVEDNLELRTFLRESLEPYYHVHEAGDGSSAIIIAAELNPDLIVSDVMMPGVNGIELCKYIKQTFETSHIPFVILSAKDGLDTKLEGLESGADYYFAKPLSTSLLLLTINNIFDRTGKLKRRYTKDHLIEATELVHSQKDKDFMNTLLQIIEDNIQNPDLEVDFLCVRMNISRTKLYQKIKGISGQSVGEFVKTIRLKRAIYIMTHEDVTLGEVADRIGLQSSSYFSRMFKKEYGSSPSEFVRRLRNASK
ncbi:hybrid sensor histidine kinase/response regulator transcription factor [Chitinophaga barathri]|nr:hybrid sensor histidine kinase/response regulator transcription factor [Chitinophaga barathri]